MEFLGSFWRSRPSGTALGAEPLVADFSINAVRRLSLDDGAPLTIELPASRLIAFPAQNAPGVGARAGSGPRPARRPTGEAPTGTDEARPPPSRQARLHRG